MRSASPCCLSTIESGRKQHYPLGGTVWNINEKVDYCTTCLQEVEDPVLVFECCGEEVCECEAAVS